MGTPLPEGIILSVVPEGTAAHGVDDDEEDQEDDVNNRHFLPVTLDVVEKASLAGLAVVAEHFWVIGPQGAVRVVVVCGARWRGPINRTHVCEATVIRWLAAP